MIVTKSGKAFMPGDLLDKSELIDIEDIAHALSQICRWSGNTPYHYSVAQHSLVVASLFRDPWERIYALMHDAAEAYVGDIVYPMKTREQSELEFVILKCILSKFGLNYYAGNKGQEYSMLGMKVKNADLWTNYHEAKIFFPGPMKELCLTNVKDRFLFDPIRETMFKKKRANKMMMDFLSEFHTLMETIDKDRGNG